MKKIILILLAIMFSFSCVFATTSEEYKQLQKDIEDADVNLKNNPNDPMMKLLKENAEKALDEAIKSDPNNLASSAFTIDTDSILPSIDMGGETDDPADFILGQVIQNMMIALGALSILVMTIGAGFMILYNGQDEMLSRGKNIIMGGIYAMIAALGSYYLVAAIRFILYQ